MHNFWDIYDYVTHKTYSANADKAYKCRLRKRSKISQQMVGESAERKAWEPSLGKNHVPVFYKG